MKKSTLLTLALITLSSTPIFSDINDYGTGYTEPVVTYYAEPSAPPAPEQQMYDYQNNYRFNPPAASASTPSYHLHTYTYTPATRYSKLQTIMNALGGAALFSAKLPFKLTAKTIRGLRSLYHLPKNLKKVLIPLAIIYGTDVTLNFAGNMGLLNFLPPEVNKLSGNIYPLINKGFALGFKGIKLPFDILKGARLNATSDSIINELNKPLENPQGFWASVKGIFVDPVTTKLDSIKTMAKPAQVSTLKALWNARKNLRTVNCIKEATDNSSLNGFIDAASFRKCFNY